MVMILDEHLPGTRVLVEVDPLAATIATISLCNGLQLQQTRSDVPSSFQVQDLWISVAVGHPCRPPNLLAPSGEPCRRHWT